MPKILVVLTALLISSTLAWGGKPTTSTCPPSSNVTVTIYDYDTGGALLLERSDDFNGTNQAQYSVTSDPYLTTAVACGSLSRWESVLEEPSIIQSAVNAHHAPIRIDEWRPA